MREGNFIDVSVEEGESSGEGIVFQTKRGQPGMWGGGPQVISRGSTDRAKAARLARSRRHVHSIVAHAEMVS